MALSGLNHESMVRGYGWRFMEIGRRLERATQSATLIKHLMCPVLSDNDQGRMMELSLLVMEGLISYRRRYGARISPQTGLNLVMLDSDNPRSLIFQLDHMLAQVRSLPNKKGYLHELPPAERVLVETTTHIRLASLSALCQEEGGERAELKATMQQLQSSLIQASDLICDRYFDHREQAQQLVISHWEGL